jgi:Kef-type K+ transport system membrane component KefB
MAAIALIAEAPGHLTETLLVLATIFISAKLMAELFERLRQPAVVGEILAGVIIGPGLLNWVEPSEISRTFAEIGVIFLLFNVGLETSPEAIFKVGRRAAIVAILGVIVPFGAGLLVMQLWGANRVESLFIGAALVATSVGITARVLGSMGLLDAPTSRIILGAAVIDDILGLLVLTFVSGMAAGDLSYLKIIVTSALAIGFTVVVALVVSPFMTRIADRIEGLRIGESFFVAGLVLCLLLSVAASYIGVAAIIGAFLAGMALAEATEDNDRMHLQTRGVTELLVPFFLVNIGLQLNLSIFRDPGVILLALVVTIVAILTKFIGCGIGAWGLGLRRSAQVGVGMVPRGEVGIVVAQLGISMGVISDLLYGVVIFMAVVTTLIAPPFLKPLFSTEAAALSDSGPQDAGGVLAREDLSHLG